jgi:hypothetical protein
MTDDSGGGDARRRNQRTRFMSEAEMLNIINKEALVPMTMTSRNYLHYQGVRRATVLTLHFSVISASFSQLFMIRNVMEVLDDHFSSNVTLHCCADYDFVLCKLNSVPKSYYPWKANSNRAQYNIVNEVAMDFTYANVNRFCQEAAQVHLPDLEINFLSSDCVIDRLTAIIISFIF